MNEGRASSRSLQGRNLVRRQLEIHPAKFDAHNEVTGEMKLRPGLWRLVFVDSHRLFVPSYGHMWFSINRETRWSGNQAYPIESTAEPITWNMGFREVFVDEECVLRYNIPANSFFEAILISELDEP
jgi:hypothetical protein